MKPIIFKIDINSPSLPHRKHIKFLMKLEEFGGVSYRHIMRKMHAEIKKTINHSGGKLAKSDNLGIGWSGRTPKIELDLNGKVSRVIEKYAEGLRWILIGDAAGEEAIAIAKEVGIFNRMPKGILTSAYMDAVESQSDYFEQIFGSEPKFSSSLQEQAIQDVIGNSNRYLDEIVAKLRNDIINSITAAQSAVNMMNTLSIGEKAFEMIKDLGAREALINASKSGLQNISDNRLNNAIRKPIKDFSTRWDTAVVGEVGLASGAAAYRTMTDVYAGRDEGGVKVCNITMEDSKVCEFCYQISFDADGNYHVYRLSDINPVGYNRGKKRAEWKIAVPAHHPHCRCSLVYVPSGFKVLKGGLIEPE